MKQHPIQLFISVRAAGEVINDYYIPKYLSPYIRKRIDGIAAKVIIRVEHLRSSPRMCCAIQKRDLYTIRFTVNSKFIANVDCD